MIEYYARWKRLPSEFGCVSWECPGSVLVLSNTNCNLCAVLGRKAEKGRRAPCSLQEATVQEFMEAVERAERRHEREHGGTCAISDAVSA